MKKIFIAVLFVFLIPFTNTYAITFNEYGADLFNDSLETSLPLNVFPYSVTQNGSNSAVVSYCQTEARHGKQSVMIDLSSMNINDTVSFGHTFFQINANPKNELYYVSFYVKGDNISSDCVWYKCLYNGTLVATYSTFGIDDADENGWHKVWCLLNYIPQYDVDSSCYVNLVFKKTSADISKIYIDDISLRTVPTVLRLYNREINDSGEFNLDDIYGECINLAGHRQDLKYKEMINYSVVSGDATINGKTLYYPAEKQQRIVLKADMLGTKCNVILSIVKNNRETLTDNKNQILIGDIKNNDGVYNVEVTNNRKTDTNAVFVIATYNKNRLYEVKTYKKTINANSKETIYSDKIIIPYNVSESDIRTYVFTS